MIARALAYLRSLRPTADMVHVVVVPEDVSARLLATPGARLRSRFEIVETIETERLVYAVETEEGMEQ